MNGALGGARRGDDRDLQLLASSLDRQPDTIACSQLGEPRSQRCRAVELDSFDADRAVACLEPGELSAEPFGDAGDEARGIVGERDSDDAAAR